MANHLFVFCASPALLSACELGEYIATLGLLDRAPRFVPTLTSAEARDPMWSWLEMIYEEGHRPIQWHRMFEPEELTPAIEDALALLDEHGLRAAHPLLVARIEGARQIFHAELSWNLPEDCWEALDALHAHIAVRLDGFVLASDGFYDRELRPICRFTSTAAGR